MKLTARLLCIVMFLGIFNLQPPSASADDYIRVFVNDTELVFPDATPFIDKNGRVVVPVRIVAEAMGCDVDWNGETKTITLSRGRIRAELTIGEKEIIVLGARKAIDTEARMENELTLMPARFVAEAFGADVSWDSKTRTLNITDERYDVYLLDKFVWEIEPDDELGINSDGFLSLTKGSGLILDENLISDSDSDNDHDNEIKFMVITITVDNPESDVATQMEETTTLLQQRFDEDFVTQIMDYALAKQTEADVIERKIFKFDDYRIYVTGYIGPIIIFVYFL